jgi:hypothetical protein
VRNYVVDPVSVQVDRPAQRAKMDSIDVVQLLRSQTKGMERGVGSRELL